MVLGLNCLMYSHGKVVVTGAGRDHKGFRRSFLFLALFASLGCRPRTAFWDLVVQGSCICSAGVCANAHWVALADSR